MLRTEMSTISPQSLHVIDLLAHHVLRLDVLELGADTGEAKISTIGKPCVVKTFFKSCGCEHSCLIAPVVE